MVVPYLTRMTDRLEGYQNIEKKTRTNMMVTTRVWLVLATGHLPFLVLTGDLLLPLVHGTDWNYCGTE